VPSLPDHLKPIPIGKDRLSQEELEELQRARLLAAAIPVFAAKGYSATTVDDLVSAARIGVGSFYAHFESKERCLLAAYDVIHAEAKAQIEGAARAGTDWPSGICLGLKALLDWLTLNRDRGKVALVEIQVAGPAAVKRYGEAVESAVNALRKGRSRSNHLPPSLEETTVGGIAWLLHRRLAVGVHEPLRELFPDLGELILEPYLGKAAAAELLRGM
jgi:AcrR family transcriptional regulator